MMFGFISCQTLFTNLVGGRKRSWDSTFLLVSTVHVPAWKCQLSYCFSTSAEEYEAKMPQYFLYELQLVHQSSMIPVFYMWAPFTVDCVWNIQVQDSQLTLRCMMYVNYMRSISLNLSNACTKVHVVRLQECLFKVWKISLLFESRILITPSYCFLNWDLVNKHVLGILGICFMSISI